MTNVQVAPFTNNVTYQAGGQNAPGAFYLSTVSGTGQPGITISGAELDVNNGTTNIYRVTTSGIFNYDTSGNPHLISDKNGLNLISSSALSGILFWANYANYVTGYSTVLGSIYGLAGGPLVVFGSYDLTIEAAATLNLQSAGGGDIKLFNSNISSLQAYAARVDTLNRFQVYNLVIPTATADQASAVAGQMYFNTSTNQLKVYTGTAWKAVTLA